MRVWHRWLVLSILSAAWMGLWLFAWQSYFFEMLRSESGPGIAVLTDRAAGVRILVAACAVGFVFASAGLFLWVYSGLVRHEAIKWSRALLIGGMGFTVFGLSFPILFPSTSSLVIDENREALALETRWLYWSTGEELAFRDIERISLRVQRRFVDRQQEACRIATGLSIIQTDRVVVEVPGGFDHEAVADALAQASGAHLERLGRQEC